jgi:hypothetical protein
VYDNLSMPVDLRKIEVYGSHLKLVESDQAIIRFSISGQHTEPKKVMAWISDKAADVEEALEFWNVAKVRSSRARLSKRVRKVKEKTAAFEDYYSTSIQYWITTPEVDKVMEIQLKLVELGVSEIYPTVFECSSLKRHSSEVRRKAIKAARDKAELYCREAGVRVGPPITIRDLNAENGSDSGLHRDSTGKASLSTGDGEVRTNGPELIAVSSNLQVVFEILVGAYID